MSLEKSTENSGFLDGREYTAAFLYELLALIVGNGVYANELEPTAINENMTITHGAGHAWINGVCYKNTTPFTLDIATADGVLNRYDSLMLRLNLSINEVYATIEQGDYAVTPTPPAITRNADIFDLKICDIYIPAGCTKITQDLITDTRMDKAVCGVPFFPVEHLDMTTFYRQVAADMENLKTKERAEIQKLLEQLNDLVEGDTVGKLIAEINKKLNKDGTEAVTGPINMNQNTLFGLADPQNDSEAVSLRFAKNNYAPAGWGFGGAMDYIVDENGTFETKLDEILAGMDSHSVKQFSFYDTKGLHSTKFYGRLWKYTPNYATLEAVNYNGNKAVKCKRSGTWNPWEWDNPLMTPGIEYRTTERFEGLTVYCGLVSYTNAEEIGDTSSNVVVEIPHPFSGLNKPVRVTGRQNGVYPLPNITSGGANYTITRVDSNSIDLRLNKCTFDSRTWYFTIYYTK